MKIKPVLRMVAKVLVGPAAGAFGVYLLAEYPAVHAAVCAAVP